MLGLYIHIPFCATKCAYCDFYSLNYNNTTVNKFVEEMCKRLKNINFVFDTVYFGGGTPSLIGAENLSKILSCVQYKPNAEITVEVNPKSYKKGFFEEIYKQGFNRISIGLQSAVHSELKSLTRKHLFNDTVETVKKARESGFDNISLDVMLGIENQTIQSLEYTLNKCIELKPTHLSCYMLKIEQNTPFANMELNLPDEDLVCDMYLKMCEILENSGFKQYEISNFAIDGFESRHNNIYWNCDDYYGIGPGAHSLINGKRYYFPNDINYFLFGNEMISNGAGGDLYDKIMLGLRLNKGIDFNLVKDNSDFLNKFKKYCELGYASKSDSRLCLTKKGFLIQNVILTDLLEVI